VGSAQVKYDPNAHTLQVQYAFTGLAPNSTHPMHVHGGHCASPGPVLYDLKTVTADGAGNSSGTASASNVTTDQPSSGWYIDLHNGTGSSTFDQLVLTCAAITGLVGVSGQPASGTIEFLEGVGPNMTAIGYAQFVDQGGTLTATVTAEGLEPGSTHPLFVRKGTCEQQSNTTFHGLYPLVANSTGAAKRATQITGVAGVPSDSWYVIVYRGTNLDSYIDAAPHSVRQRGDPHPVGAGRFRSRESKETLTRRVGGGLISSRMRASEYYCCAQQWRASPHHRSLSLRHPEHVQGVWPCTRRHRRQRVVWLRLPSGVQFVVDGGVRSSCLFPCHFRPHRREWGGGGRFIGRFLEHPAAGQHG
jgi:hypothetical protein